MVDSINIYKSFNIVTTMKNPEMLKFVSDHLKIKKKTTQYKAQQMCDKAILENDGTLKFVPDSYENQEMGNKAVDNYPHVHECYWVIVRLQTKWLWVQILVKTYPFRIKLIPELFMTHKMYDKAVNRLFLVFDSISNQYKTQSMCNSIMSNDHFSMRYVPDQYKIQPVCDIAVDDCLAALKFVAEWLVKSKMIKRFFTTLYADENILYFNENPSNTVFNCNGVGILNIDLNNMNLDNTDYEEDDSDTINYSYQTLAWQIKFKKRKTLKEKISEELMPIAQHPKRWWDWCMSKNEKEK